MDQDDGPGAGSGSWLATHQRGEQRQLWGYVRPATTTLTTATAPPNPNLVTVRRRARPPSIFPWQ
jgi:hypothetical protein